MPRATNRMNTKTSQYVPPETDKALVLAWVRRTRENQTAHYLMAQSLSRYDRWFGVPAIVISALVGISAFSSIAAEVIPNYAKIAVGCLSVLAGVLTSLQTFFKFSERSEKHNTAGIRYGCLRRKLEYLHIQEKIDKKVLEGLLQELDKLAEDSPHVPASIFPKVQSNIHFIGGQAAADDGASCGFRTA